MRCERLVELMERHRLGAVVMRRPENFAWYTGGANSRVDYVATEGVADLAVTGGYSPGDGRPQRRDRASHV